jgi:N-acetylglucosamine kinase-like BadF-type ATPase
MRQETIRAWSLFRNAAGWYFGGGARLAYSLVMRVFLGMDGGGTKTECVLLAEDGHTAGTGRAGASNPTRVGFENAAKAVEDAAAVALREAGAERSDVAALCAGLAGTGRPENRERMKALLSAAFPGALVQVMTDLELPLSALPEGPAIVLVAGTGSAAIGRDANGNVLRAGGLGRDVSDEGSAYDVGVAAIQGAVREQSRGGVDSPLGRQILRQLGCHNWEEVLERIAADRDAVYPRVFPVVAVAADAGDPSARKLLDAAAEKLTELVRKLAAQLGLSGLPFDLAKTGGMLGRSSCFDEALAKSLGDAAPQARIVPLPFSPPEAAARIAFRLSQSSQRSGS